MSKRHQELITAACELACEPETVLRVLKPFKGVYRQLHKKAEAGKPTGALIEFDLLSRSVIWRWLQEQGIDPEVGIPQHPASRTEMARHQISEKIGAAKLADVYGLMAVCAAGDEVPTLNAVPIQTGLGAYTGLTSDPTLEVGADWILTIENYDTFLILCREPGRLARAGRGLVVFRSAPTLPAGMRWAQTVAAAQGIAHWHAPDLDPHGLSDCLSEKFAGVWIPSIAGGRASVMPDRRLFDKQLAVVAHLEARAAKAFPALRPWLEWVREREAGITQERAFAAELEFVWLENEAAIATAKDLDQGNDRLPR